MSTLNEDVSASDSQEITPDEAIDYYLALHGLVRADVERLASRGDCIYAASPTTDPSMRHFSFTAFHKPCQRFIRFKMMAGTYEEARKAALKHAEERGLVYLGPGLIGTDEEQVAAALWHGCKG